jgi:signal transduction histidine kinase
MDEMTRLQHFARNLGRFWKAVTWCMVIGCLAIALVIDHIAPVSARGGMLIALSAGFLALFELCMQAKRFRMRFTRQLSRWWILPFWLGMCALVLALTALDRNFDNLMWVLFGMALTLPMPVGGMLAAIPTLVVLHATGIVPDFHRPQSLIEFALAVLGLVCYASVIYLPLALLHQRFERERLFRDLEKAHADLRQAHEQLAVAAEHERELAVLLEREQLARDLHDSLGHAIILALMQLEVAQRVRAAEPERADLAVARSQGVLRDAMAELRATLASLRCPDGARLSLPVQLDRLARAAAERADLDLICTIDPEAAKWPHTIQAAFLRVASEAITNCERHASARSLHVIVRADGDTAMLWVEDDGKGMDELARDETGAPLAPTGHFGLAGMRERMAAIGGSIALGPAPCGGTRVEAHAPLRAVAAVPARG